MDDIRESAAMLLRRHTFWTANHSSIGPEAHCLCGKRPKGFPEWTTHVADVLVSELGLAAPRCEACGVSYGHAAGCVEQLT